MNIKLKKSIVLGAGVIGYIDQVIDIDKVKAKQLIAKGAAEEADEEAAATGFTQEQIIKAITALDADDEAAWTKDNVPKVPAIESVLGGSITAAKRDEAWATFSA